ncbi:hypothetical protein BX666DRAFT_653495 [Dichotomocladium elegans]|nr:hypothetical protein BX666DRAFT_653495 [Dichotomocladium elegans]
MLAVSSPMVGSMSSPVQGQMPGVGPGMNRVIPSQSIGRYMQHMSATQQVMMQGTMQAMSSPMSNASRQISSQAQPPPQHNVGQAEQTKDNQSNNSTPNFPQQSPMQKNAVSPAPHRSVTPGSTTSTPLQQHRQAEVAAQQQQQQQQPPQQQHSFKANSPNTTIEVPNHHGRPPPQTPRDAAPKTETPSPKPSPVVKNEQVNSPSTAINEKGPVQSQLTTYVPKTRTVDTYGGVDLKYFDKFDLKPLVPHFAELGVVDIHALIMSLKSEMKMEVANALNILTVVTAQNNLAMGHCEDLLDVLLDYMERDIFGTNSRFELNGIPKNASYMAASTEHDLTYAELFDMSLDEMKSLIPTLEGSTSDLWLSLRERCLCIFNIFRNISFMPDNVEYLARHDRFVTLLARIMDSTRHAESTEGKDTSGREAWFVGVRRMDTLDFRKSILLIFSNIAMQLHIRHTDMGSTFIRLTRDFLASGPDTYYALLAAETWAKVAVNYENRKLFSALVEKTSVACLQDIWIELASLIRREFFKLDGKVTFNLTSSQLATLEFTIMGMYSIVGILNELPEERQLREQLFQSDRTVAMMILRLCVSLGESGVPNFNVATKRGMELVRNFVCGSLPMGGRQGEVESKTDDNAEGATEENVIKAAHRMLDMSAVRHMLMMAMLRPHADAMMLRDLSDLVTLIDGDNVDSFVA